MASRDVRDHLGADAGLMLRRGYGGSPASGAANWPTAANIACCARSRLDVGGVPEQETAGVITELGLCGAKRLSKPGLEPWFTVSLRGCLPTQLECQIHVMLCTQPTTEKRQRHPNPRLSSIYESVTACLAAAWSKSAVPASSVPWRRGRAAGSPDRRQVTPPRERALGLHPRRRARRGTRG